MSPCMVLNLIFGNIDEKIIHGFEKVIHRLEFYPLSLKYGFTVFQKIWLSITFLTLKFS